MEDEKERLRYLIGDEGLLKLSKANIIIFGLGGVGSYVAEALARSFVGNITIVDFDVVSVSNINRQLIANFDTIGKSKAELVKKRIESVNKNCKITVLNKMLTTENIKEFKLEEYDYVIDAIDSIFSKVCLIRYAAMNKIKIISSMGMGNKFAPEKIKIDRLENTVSCKLARKLKRELKNTKSASKIMVVYSSEVGVKHNNPKPGSTAFVPSTAGLIISSYIVRKILNIEIR